LFASADHADRYFKTAHRRTKTLWHYDLMQHPLPLQGA